jgi:hypothetical protein
VIAVVYRMLEGGHRLERGQALRQEPARGELALRARLTNRGPGWDVYLAMLMTPSYGYVIPPLDRAKLVAIRGRWLQISGLEIHPHKRNHKSLSVSRYEQEWWCRVEGAVAQDMTAAARLVDSSAP